jgi:hypothetical protein
VVLTDSVEHAVTVPSVKNASVEFASATEVAMGRNAVPTTVELFVELASQDKPVTMESVQEPVLLNVLDLMAPSEHVVGIDATEKAVVELAPTVQHATSVAVTEPVNVSLSVTISTVEMTVVEDPVELVLTEESVKVLAIPSLVNVTSTVTLKSELKSERTEPETWLVQLAQLPLLVPTLLMLPQTPTQDPIPDSSFLIFQLESMETTNLPPIVQDTNWILRLMLSMFQDNSSQSSSIGIPSKLKSEMRQPVNYYLLLPSKFLLDLTL